MVRIAALAVLVLDLLVVGQRARAGDNQWTWTGLSGNVMQIVTDPLHPDTVYAVAGEGRDAMDQIVRSTDGGVTWTNVALPAWKRITSVALAYTAPNVVYATTSSGVFRSSNYGDDWQLINSDPAGEAVTVSPVDPDTAYVATSMAVEGTFKAVILRTFDGGETWTTETSGLPDYPPIDQLVVAPSAPHILIAKPFNMANGPLFKSVDYGQTWFPIGGSQLVSTRWVTVDPKSSSVIYLGTFSPGAWKSTDGGTSWMPIANGLQQNGGGFVVDPDNTQVVHASSDGSGVVESLDGGMSWTPMNYGIQGLQVGRMAIASRQPLVLYASVANAGIWKFTQVNVPDFGISINEGAIFANRHRVTLALSAPQGTTQMQISNDGGFADATWEPFAVHKEWTITSPGSAVLPRVVYVKFKVKGQVSATYQDDIVFDATKPSGNIVVQPQFVSTAAGTIAPAPALQGTDAYTLSVPFAAKTFRPGFRSVKLILTASDDLSGVESVIVSNTPDFAGSQWEEYTPAMAWSVKEHGLATVYAKYRDRAGNESTTYTAETAAP